MRTIDAVTVKLSGGSFTLLVDNAAIVRLEENYNIDVDKVSDVIFGKPLKIRKVCEVGACFINQDGVTAEALLKAAPLPEDLVELASGISKALVNYFPPKKAGEGSEGGDDAEAGRPFGNGS